MKLYTIVLILSIIVPLALSFEKKLMFYKKWKYLFLSMLLTSLVFIPFDIYFTSEGIWGFNSRYHSSIIVFNLPLEEWLFFFIIPYASIFLYETIVYYFRKFRLNYQWSIVVLTGILVLSLFIIVFNFDKKYTLYIFSFVILSSLLCIRQAPILMGKFLPAFLVIMVPFIIVNTILTGGVFGKEVFWYNSNEILDVRLLTIPVEDIGFSYNLILLNLLVVNKLSPQTSD